MIIRSWRPAAAPCLPTSRTSSCWKPSDAESAERVFIAEHPDICVIDINLPTVSGFELARRILAHDASARIIMFSMNDDPVFVARAIETGAKGYVSKTGDPHDLVEAIREVGKGGVYLPPALARSIAFAGPAVAQEPAAEAQRARNGNPASAQLRARACRRSPGWCTRPTRRWRTPPRSSARSSACGPRPSWCGWRSRAASPDVDRSIMTLQTLSLNRSHGGTQGVYRHASRETETDMTFSVFVPDHREGTKLAGGLVSLGPDLHPCQCDRERRIPQRLRRTRPDLRRARHQPARRRRAGRSRKRL